MKISIQQPEFVPWAGFFNKILGVDKTVILDSVQFKKRYFENRCRIQINDQVRWLTVPVVTKGRYNQTIAEVEVDNTRPWGPKAYNTLVQAYKHSPYWADHGPFLEKTFLSGKWERLIDLNMEIIQYVCNYLSISFDHCLASDFGLSSKGSDLILDLCKKSGASAYLSGEAGHRYLDSDIFNAEKILVSYQEFTPQPYLRFSGAYQGPLGMIDVLCSLGKSATRHIVT